MTSYSMIQRALHTDYTRTKLVFKPGDSDIDKLKKTLQYLTRIIGKELEGYVIPADGPEPTSTTHPNAPTQENINKLIDFLVKVGYIKQPILPPEKRLLPTTEHEQRVLKASVGLNKNATLEEGRLPILLDITTESNVVQYWGAFKTTEYDQYVDVENNQYAKNKLEIGLQMNNDRSTWPVQATNRMRNVLILDLSKSIKTGMQGAGYTFNTVGTKSYVGFNANYWEYMWAVYRFHELLDSEDSWGQAMWIWWDWLEVWLDRVKPEKREAYQATLDVEEDRKKFFRLLVRNGTNFTKKRNSLLFGISAPVMAFYQEQLAYYYRDEINIQMMNSYETGQSATRASAFETKKQINNEKRELMMHNHYLTPGGFGYVEIDNDVLVEDFDIMQKEWTSLVKILPSTYDYPHVTKPTLRFRKLGNYRATGIYNPTLNAIAIDSSSSFLHEYGHMLDFQLRGTGSTYTLSLSKAFSEVLVMYQDEYRRSIDNKGGDITHRTHQYYLTPTEVFARAFETFLRNKGLECHSLGTIPGKNKEVYSSVPYEVFEYKPLMREVNSYFEKLYMESMSITPEHLAQVIPEINQTIKNLGQIDSIRDTGVTPDVRQNNEQEDFKEEYAVPQPLHFSNQLRRKTFEDLLIQFDDYSDANYLPQIIYKLNDKEITFAVSTETDIEVAATGYKLEPWVQSLFKQVYDRGVQSQEPIPTLANKFIVAFNKHNHKLKYANK